MSGQDTTHIDDQLLSLYAGHAIRLARFHRELRADGVGWGLAAVLTLVQQVGHHWPPRGSSE